MVNISKEEHAANERIAQAVLDAAQREYERAAALEQSIRNESEALWVELSAMKAKYDQMRVTFEAARRMTDSAKTRLSTAVQSRYGTLSGNGTADADTANMAARLSPHVVVNNG